MFSTSRQAAEIHVRVLRPLPWVLGTTGILSCGKSFHFPLVGFVSMISLCARTKVLDFCCNHPSSIADIPRKTFPLSFHMFLNLRQKMKEIFICCDDSPQSRYVSIWQIYLNEGCGCTLKPSKQALESTPTLGNQTQCLCVHVCDILCSMHMSQKLGKDALAQRIQCKKNPFLVGPS